MHASPFHCLLSFGPCSCFADGQLLYDDIKEQVDDFALQKGGRGMGTCIMPVPCNKALQKQGSSTAHC